MVNTYSTLKGEFEAFEMNMTPKCSDDFIIAAALAAHRKWYEHFRRVMKITYVLISPETKRYSIDLVSLCFGIFSRLHLQILRENIPARF